MKGIKLIGLMAVLFSSCHPNSKSNSNDLQLQNRNGNSIASTSLINGKGVAAAAFDKVNNRLYFSEMMGNQLKYIDFANSTTNNLNIGVDENERFSTGVKSVDESNIITRMAFANDGVGYALTNDAKSFMRFTTNESSTITNLGEIRDSKRNTSVSIHNQCTSWGGDMIGDIYGNLFLISMRNNVFKINIAKLEAEYIGTITNLPATFTTNGAVADDDGNIILSSATISDSYFKVNPSTWVATAIKGGNEMYSVSDMANGNLVYQRKSSSTTELVTLNNEVSIFPNPAINKNVNVSFNKLKSGNYTINVADINGKSVLTKQVNINGSTLEKMILPTKANSGVYMLRVIDSNGKTVYTNKVVVD